MTKVTPCIKYDMRKYKSSKMTSKYIRVENCTAFIFTDNIFLAIDLRLFSENFTVQFSVE